MSIKTGQIIKKSCNGELQIINILRIIIIKRVAQCFAKLSINMQNDNTPEFESFYIE